MPQASLVVALGFLSGLIESNQVRFADLDRFVHTDWSLVPDGQIAVCIDSAVVYALGEVAKAVAYKVYGDPSIALESMREVLKLFALKTTRGEVTPASLAILCNCSVTDFEV